MRALTRLLVPALLLGLFLLAAGPGGAVSITIVNQDGAGEGFNDPTPAVPVPGNAGTTLGQQRLNVFMAAAAYWSNRLSSSVPITVAAQMDPLTCSPTSGILGAAGAEDFFANFPNAPHVNTWYPSALANALAGSDLDTATPEIVAQFNSRLGTDTSCLTGLNWWYGIGGAVPAHTVPFYQTGGPRARPRPGLPDHRRRHHRRSGAGVRRRFHAVPGRPRHGQDVGADEQ
jgi:hypothetical protein